MSLVYSALSFSNIFYNAFSAFSLVLHWQNYIGPPEYVLLLKNKHSKKKYHGLIRRWVSFTFFQLSLFTIQWNPNWQNEVEGLRHQKFLLLLLKIENINIQSESFTVWFTHFINKLTLVKIQQKINFSLKNISAQA